MVSVSCGVDDATARQADELCRRVAERTAEVSYEATGMYPTQHRATFHVLHSSGRRPRLPVSVSVGDDRVQLLLFHVSRPTPASDSCMVSIALSRTACIDRVS